MKLRLFLMLLLYTGLFVSCSSYKNMLSSDNNIKKIELGMTKDQVISIMGDSYEIIRSKEGLVVLGYESRGDGIYKLRFVNGILTEWNKEWLHRYPVKDAHYNSDKKETATE